MRGVNDLHRKRQQTSNAMNTNRNDYLLVEAVYSAATDAERWPLLLCELANVFDSHVARLRAALPHSLPIDLEYHRPAARPTLALAYRGLPAAHRSRPLDKRSRVLSRSFQLSMGHNGNLALRRSRTAPGFTAEDFDRFERVVDHVRRTFEIYAQLSAFNAARRAALGVLDTYGQGIVLVKRDGKVVFTNPAARLVFDALDGLVVHEETIRCANPAADRALSAAIGRATNFSDAAIPKGGIAVKVDRISANVPYSLRVFPGTEVTASEAMTPTARLATVFVTDPLKPVGAKPDGLSQFFNVGETQADVLWQLMGGKSVRQIAIGLRITENAVRQHLKVLFGATGTSSQAALLAHAFAAAPWHLATSPSPPTQPSEATPT